MDDRDDEHAPEGGAATYDLIAPDLDVWERAVRAAEPSLADAAVRDRALRQARAHFRHEASDRTMAYLTWRAERARAAASDSIAASVAARDARAEARGAPRVGHGD